MYTITAIPHSDLLSRASLLSLSLTYYIQHLHKSIETYTFIIHSHKTIETYLLNITYIT